MCALSGGETGGRREARDRTGRPGDARRETSGRTTACRPILATASSTRSFAECTAALGMLRTKPLPASRSIARSTSGCVAMTGLFCAGDCAEKPPGAIAKEEQSTAFLAKSLSFFFVRDGTGTVRQGQARDVTKEQKKEKEKKNEVWEETSLTKKLDVTETISHPYSKVSHSPVSLRRHEH